MYTNKAIVQTRFSLLDTIPVRGVWSAHDQCFLGEEDLLDNPYTIPPFPLQKLAQGNPVVFEGFVSDDVRDAFLGGINGLFVEFS